MPAPFQDSDAPATKTPSSPHRRIKRNLRPKKRRNTHHRNRRKHNRHLGIIIPDLRLLQMRRGTPHMQKHADDHAYRRARQKRNGRLPRQDLRDARLASGVAAVLLLAVGLAEETSDVFEAA